MAYFACVDGENVIGSGIFLSWLDFEQVITLANSVEPLRALVPNLMPFLPPRLCEFPQDAKPRLLQTIKPGGVIVQDHVGQLKGSLARDLTVVHHFRQSQSKRLPRGLHRYPS